MFSDYLIQCGIILQFVPPGTYPAATEPLPLHPPAVIRHVDYQQDEETAAELDEHTIRQLIQLRKAIGIRVAPDDSDEFEETLREEYGANPSAAPASFPPRKTVDLLRASGERLDKIANQLERQDNFEAADHLRHLAQRLRLHGREVGRSLILE